MIAVCLPEIHSRLFERLGSSSAKELGSLGRSIPVDHRDGARVTSDICALDSKIGRSLIDANRGHEPIVIKLPILIAVGAIQATRVVVPRKLWQLSQCDLNHRLATFEPSFGR